MAEIKPDTGPEITVDDQSRKIIKMAEKIKQYKEQRWIYCVVGLIVGFVVGMFFF